MKGLTPNQVSRFSWYEGSFSEWCLQFICG